MVLGVDGTDLTDTATLSGATTGATGTITFKLYNDATCTPGGLVGTVTKTVDGQRRLSSSPIVHVNAAGTYHWIANYGGDGNNNATANGCNGANENVVVIPRSSSVTTQASADVALGANGNDLTDTATLSGATTTATGTITFKLYNDATCTPAGLVGTVTKTVTGNGVYVSPSIHVNAAGTYHWIANYGGDANNNATANGCNGANENVRVSQPGIHIVKSPDTQTVRVGDTAAFTLAVTNTGDVALSNIVVGDAKCDAPPVYQSGDANANSKLDLTETWTYTCSMSNVLASFQNLATAKGTPPVGPDVNDQDTAEVVVIHPAIKIVKSPDTQTVRVGDTAAFTLAVTNTGDVALSNIVVGDAKCDAPPVYQSGDTTRTRSSI